MSDRDHDELGLVRSTLDAWEPMEPSPGFAEKVVRRLDSERREPDASSAAGRRRRPWRLVALMAAAAALVASGVGVARWATRDGASGAIVTRRRETIRIGDRAVAVAEAASELRWTVDVDGTARVDQARGKVFYRVERSPDHPFVVHTPGGDVRVLGTSFHVEVEEEPVERIVSKRSVASAAVGAALATAVVVTVYEGRVALATDHGSTAIGPGETAWASRDAPPSEAVDVGGGAADAAAVRRPDGGSDYGTLDDARAPAPVLRERLAALQAQRDEQRAELDALQAHVRELEGAADGGPATAQRLRSGPWWPPAQEDLEALVEQCGVRSDTPPILGLEPGQVGEEGARMGLRADEVPVVNEAIRRLRESFLRRLRPLYIEATGDEAGAQGLSADAMMAQINSAAAEGEVQEAHRQLALELAGRAEPPEDVSSLPPAAQALRLYDGLGDELQQLLAAELGADRACELRAAAGGWPWGRSYSRTCE